MAVAAWKRLEKSDPYQRAKLALKRLVGQEPRLRPQTTTSQAFHSGWCYDPTALDENSIVYSLGVGDDICFDLALIDRYKLIVHAFDPTPMSVSLMDQQDHPDNFRFHPWAVAASDGSLKLYPRSSKSGVQSEVMYTMVPDAAADTDPIHVPAYSLQSLLDKLGHTHVDMIKMDIEGAEYDVLNGLLESDCRPGQLLIEFHHRFVNIGVARTNEMIERLNAAGYRIFSVAVTGREISLIHRPDG